MSGARSWQEFFENEGEQEYFRKLMKKVDAEYRNFEIFPPREQIFAAFQKCPLENLRVVIIGQDPYHGRGQAHGLAFSVERGAKIPPSLRNIFKELRADLDEENVEKSGKDSAKNSFENGNFEKVAQNFENGNLENWARQGVLLLNSTLTVRAGEANSHARLGWADFTARVLDFLNDFERPLVFILWGSNAQELGERISSEKHLKIASAHPSPLSARRGFFGSKPFSRANDFLSKNGHEKIDWKI